VTGAIQVMQDSPWAWFADYGIPILFLAAIPAIVLYRMAIYLETVVYDSHKPTAGIPRSARQWRVISMYRYHRQRLDLLLLILYMSSFLLVLEAGFLLGGLPGIVVGLIVGIEMNSRLWHGIRLESRVGKKIAEEKR
jgi:hypothetical protein